jgi:hypothetical protein
LHGINIITFHQWWIYIFLHQLHDMTVRRRRFSPQDWVFLCGSICDR